jgi:hypothetical protein
MTISGKFLSIVLFVFAMAHAAKSQEFTSPIPECAHEFYDPLMYRWISYENKCAGAIHVTLVGLSKPHSGGLDIKPGGKQSPGMDAKEVEAVGGLKAYVCPAGYLAVNADDNKLIIVKVVDRYVCKSTTILNTGHNSPHSPPPSTETYGVQLWRAAQSHQGAAYEEGMQCSDLIIAASNAIGLHVPVGPLGKGETVTGNWFAHGMGPEFRAIVTNIPLSEDAKKYGDDLIKIPIGSVIVTNGHAALFDGVVRVRGKWELITYDANDRRGWTVSLSGNPSETDPTDRMLKFPGHQVGQHVTRLQWGSDRLVSVYQPIGK